MSAHPTSGPWQVKHDFDLDGLTTVIGNVDGEIIDGTTHHSFDFVCRTIDEADDSQSPEVAVANARLCAVAPEMLVMLCQYADDLRYPPEGDSRERRLAAAQALIAKATGQ